MFYHPVLEEAAPGKTVPPGKGKSGKKAAPTQAPTALQEQVRERPPVSTSPRPTPADGGQIIRATAPPPTQGPALGLRYAILKKHTEVAADTVFHKGDQVQLRIETNQPAYLYIISQGSSGAWKVRVPSAEVPGSNRVEARTPYEFPSKGQAFGFDNLTGAEKLFVIVSRDAVPDIQDQMGGLQGRPAVVESRLNIPDDKISQMRQLYSRDLIIEPVNPDTTGDKEARKEFAMYVVNPTGSPNSRLVADISLEHQ